MLAMFLLCLSFAFTSEIFSAQVQQPATTVFIHGTLFPMVSRLYHGVSCPAGMSLAKELPKNNTLGNLARTLASASPTTFPLDSFFVLGWPGALNAQQRLTVAKDLYAWIKKQNCTSLTIIGHSHGATIALLLAQLAADEKYNLTINKLILFACPVQKATAHLVKSSAFKRVYNLYSEADLGQICDPQGYNFCFPILSERFFEQSENLVQAAILLDGAKPGHNDFLLKEQFVRQLPSLLELLDRVGYDKRNKNHFVTNIGQQKIHSIKNKPLLTEE